MTRLETRSADPKPTSPFVQWLVVERERFLLGYRCIDHRKGLSHRASIALSGRLACWSPV